jgi:hypothetical protein
MIGNVAFTSTTLGSVISSATQPAANDSSTKIPTTAWVQQAILQYFQPSTVTVTSNTQLYPPNGILLKATGYIIGFGGLPGSPALPDNGPWQMGGAGGGAGAISFSFTLSNITQYLYFSVDVSGNALLSFNSTTPSGAVTFAQANVGGTGGSAATGNTGGTGSSGVFTSGNLPFASTNLITNGTAGENGGSGQTGATIVIPAAGINSVNLAYGFGQRNYAMTGYNTFGFQNIAAAARGEAVCVITWSVN